MSLITLSEVQEKLSYIKTKKSNSPGGIPAKLIKAAAEDLSVPLSDMINTSIRLGQWLDIYKTGTITPAPKV